jgi:hypothetical protein
MVFVLIKRKLRGILKESRAEEDTKKNSKQSQKKRLIAIF